MTDILQIVQAITMALGLVVTLLLAPGEALGWLKKLLILGLVLEVFDLMVPSLVNLQVFFYYVMNIASYKLFPESFWLISQQAFVLFVTFELFLWIVGRHHTASSDQNQSSSK